MKTMKVALLATAALAAVSVAARADDTAAIKAQLEALNARIAQLEAAPSLPTGYSLLTMTEVAPLVLTGEKASDRSAIKSSNRISILPTADAPASTTIDWDIEIRTALTYTDINDDNLVGVLVVNNDDEDLSIHTRARVRVKATTDTSVGTVGVDARIQGGAGEFGGGADVVMNIAWGWWQMTPEWTLGGGYTGSLSDPGHGMDGYATFGTTIAFGQGDQEQFRVTYASGPLTWAVALEDGDGAAAGSPDTDLGVATRLDYAGDAFSASLSGYYGNGSDTIVAPLVTSDAWQVAAGADFSLGDMALISVNGAIGSGYLANDDYTGLTAFVSFDVTDTTSFEASAGRRWNEGTSNDTTAANVGVYWHPADQLKIGLQADRIWNQGSFDPDTTTASFVTWFSY
jgi:hypothetical protein